MAPRRLCLLLIQTTFLLLLCLLALHKPEEFISLNLGLSGKSFLFVIELLDSGYFEL